MNTDTYQNALESTKDSIEDVNNAIGFSLGSLTLEKLITSAVTLVICVLVIWLVMRVARRISAHSRLSESLSRFILKVLKIALEFMAILIVADSLGFNVTALLAVFSLLGLALSLSVQNCLSNAMMPEQKVPVLSDYFAWGVLFTQESVNGFSWVNVLVFAVMLLCSAALLAVGVALELRRLRRRRGSIGGQNG